MKITIGIVATLCLVSSAWAGVIADSSLGTIGIGDVVIGDFEGGAANNTAGWSGIDDVYTINHPGGELTLDLNWNLASDIDLRLYEADEATYDSSYAVPGPEQITGDYPAGTYYALVDIWSGSPSSYELTVTPEPASLALLGLGALAFVRRR